MIGAADSTKEHAVSSPAARRRGDLLRRGRFIASGVMRQVIIQGLSGAAALLLVRALSKDGYAQYTIGAAAVGFSQTLSDLGLTSSLIGLGGPRCDDLGYLAALRGQIGRIRAWLMAAALALVSTYVIWIGARHGWGKQTSFALALAVCWVCYLQSRVAIDGALTRVLGLSEQWQISELFGAIAKVLCSAILWVVGSATGAFGLVVLGSGYVAQWGSLRRRRELRLSESPVSAEGEVKDAVWRYVRPLLFPAVFYSVYGQLSVFILAWLGISGDIADLGALGRVGQILTVPGALVSTYWIPRIAREKSLHRARRLSILCGVVLLGLTGAFVASGYLLPGMWVTLLGTKYSEVGTFLWMAIAISSMTLLDSTLYNMTISRGYTSDQWLTVPAHVAGLIAGVLVVRPHNLQTLLRFDLVRLSIPLCVQTCLFARHCLNTRDAR